MRTMSSPIKMRRIFELFLESPNVVWTEIVDGVYYEVLDDRSVKIASHNGRICRAFLPSVSSYDGLTHPFCCLYENN